MNNTPNQSNPRANQPPIKRPVRAVRRPGETPTAGTAPQIPPPARPTASTAPQTPPPARPTARAVPGVTPSARSRTGAAPGITPSVPPTASTAPQTPPPARPTASTAPQTPPTNRKAVPMPKPAPRTPGSHPANAGEQKPVSTTPQKKADAPTEKISLAHRMAEADASATRRMDVTPVDPKGEKSRGGEGGGGKKQKKQISEGVATLLSIVKAITYIVFVIVIAGFISYYTIYIANDMFAFVKSDEQVTVTIPENATIYDVSEVLAESGIITYPDVFEFYAKLNHDDGKFVAGDYEINGMMNYDELLMAFKERRVRGRIWLTIPEGYSVDEIIDLFLENNIGGTREDWVKAVNHLDLYAESFPFVKALIGNLSEDRTYALEGYLFPDTYEFYTDAKASQIVYKLLNRFNNVFRADFYTRAAELGYTVDEIVVLASMIEKETRLYNEFELVSSVFHNRLRDSAKYPYLESDATIQYAVRHDTGERKEEMTRDDWGYESPYNTYIHRGLPPGPIANPSYQAITCALYPEETKYYFFVARKNGETIFSSTIDEHNAAVAEVSREG